jgi:hypothetical protein
LHGLIHQVLDILWLTYIARHDQGLLAPLACQPLRKFLQAVLAPREQRDTRPTFHQLLGDGFSNPTTCTRDNRGFSSQIGRLWLLTLHISSELFRYRGTIQLPVHGRWRIAEGNEATGKLPKVFFNVYNEGIAPRKGPVESLALSYESKEEAS